MNLIDYIIQSNIKYIITNINDLLNKRGKYKYYDIINTK